MHSENFVDKVQREGLSRRAVKGGLWVFLLRVTERGVSLARLVIVARVLMPYDFGVMGIGLLTISVLEMFSQTGFWSALIQKKEDIKSYLNVSWTVLVLRGIILFAVIYLSAFHVATFFGVPEAGPIIQVIGISVLFQAFTNIGVVYFEKELEFNKVFVYRFTGTLVDFVVAVSAVFVLRSVWALVLGLLAGNAVRCLASYFIHPFRPHLSTDFRKGKELFGFGKWIMGTHMLVFLLLEGDDMFVGKILGASALGLYQMAFRISNLPATEITNVAHQVSFPLFSKLQDDQDALKNTYLRVLQMTAFLSVPLAGGIVVLAPDIIRIMLGEKWISATCAVQILAIFGMQRSIASITSGSLLRAKGKPNIETKIQISRLLLLATFIYPSTKLWGITGTAIAVVLSGVILEPFIAFIGVKTSKCGLRAYGKAVGIPFLSAALMVLAIFVIRTSLPIQIGPSVFISLLLCGILAYGTSVYLLDSWWQGGIKNFIFDRVIPHWRLNERIGQD